MTYIPRYKDKVELEWNTRGNLKDYPLQRTCICHMCILLLTRLTIYAPLSAKSIHKCKLRGRPFDSEGGGGGGWYFWSGQIIYFHHVLGRKIYFRVNRGQNQPQQIFEKATKKKKNIKINKKKGGGGGSARV